MEWWIAAAARSMSPDVLCMTRRASTLGNVTVTKALEVSSDVGAIRLAQRMGPETFYKYIRAFGFGDRSGIELPGETRGLLKPVHRWHPDTIGSIPWGRRSR
jgi:cell division protein FtsI (penicillin-binding protein 3)